MKGRGPRRVYFIRPIGQLGPVKIGCSVSPHGRRETLQSWSPIPLEVVAEILGDYLLERRFHTLFIKSHRGYEWFDHTPELEAVIASINAEKFDVGTLPEAVNRTRFRAPKDLSYITPEWRYRNSVFSRLRPIRGAEWIGLQKRLSAIVGSESPDGATLLPHRDAIEELIAEARSSNRRRA